MEALLVRPKTEGQARALEFLFREMDIPFGRRGDEARKTGFDMKLLDEAIEKARPSMDRITDVDGLVESLKGTAGL